MGNPLSSLNPIKCTKEEKYISFAKYTLTTFPKPHILWRWLTEIKNWDLGIIFIKIDPLYQENLKLIAEVAKTILEKSSLTIKFLSNSILLYDLAITLERYCGRILYSLPLATHRSDKFLTLQELQSRNFRTYAFVEAKIDLIEETLNNIDFEKSEEVWVDPLKKDQMGIFSIIQKFPKKELKKIRFFLYTQDLTLLEDQFFKTYCENIIRY